MGNPRTIPKRKNVDADSEVHAAARAGDLRAIEVMCNSDPLAVNYRDKHSRTPLHLAAWSGHAEIVSYLCKNKADVGASAMDDTSAVHFASQKGHVEVVRILLSSGASVKSTNRKGMTPLHFAAQSSHLELAKYLIRKGASLETKNKGGETPLDLAKSDEIRSLLAECASSGEEPVGARKGAEPPATVSGAEDGGGESCGDDASVGGRGRREGEAVADEDVMEAKKRKVSLLHLEAEDDDAEEEC